MVRTVNVKCYDSTLESNAFVGIFNTPVIARFAITTDMDRVLPFPLVNAPVTSAVALKNVLRGKFETK